MMKNLKKFLLCNAILMAVTLVSSCSNNETDSSDAEMEPIEASVTALNLSNQRVTAFAEDSHGFIWIGTFRGLNRYNSHQFHQYYCTDEPDDIPDNQINDLFRDSKGRLWISTIWGISIHNNTDKFQLIPFDGGRVYCKQVFESDDGRIFAISNNRMACLDEDSLCFRTVVESKRQTVDYQYGFIGNGGRIWLCSSSGAIEIYDGHKFNCVETLQVDALPTCFYRDREKGYLAVGTVEGLRCIDITLRRTIPLPSPLAARPTLASKYISAIHRYNDNSMLFNTVNGLFLYRENTGEVLNQYENGFPFEVPDFINALYTDSRGSLWIGSYDQGFRIVNGKDRFNNDQYLALKLRNKSVYSVAADSHDRLWMATLQGPLYMYDGKTAEFGTIDVDGYSNQGRAITIVHVDQNDNIWVGSLIGGKVDRCHFENGRLHSDRQYAIAQPHVISEDEAGNIWVGTSAGKLIRISADDESVTDMPLPPGANSFVSAVTQMPNGDVWMAVHTQPIFALNPETGKIQEAGIDSQQWKECLRRSTFIPTDMYCDSAGDLWIGTIGNGLLKYNFETDSLMNMKGLPCTDISSIREDRQGIIWISTQYGLASYDRTSGKFKRYFNADGIGGNQFYDRSNTMLSDGTIVFGGTHGITIFNPLDMKKPNTYPFVFDELKIHNSTVFATEQPKVIDQALWMKPKVTLKHNQNEFSITYASLNYVTKEHASYLFKLEGHDKFWVEAGQRNEAHYANLRPGNYTFRVRQITPNGDNAEREISIPIYVKAAPWLTWWAQLGYIIIVMGIFLAIRRMRANYNAEREQRRRAELDREQERRLNTMHMSFFANISHEFRTPLTMISGPVSLLQSSENLSSQERRLLNVVQRNVLRMLRLVNQLMDFNKLENDRLYVQVEHIDALVYLRHMIENFSVSAEEKGIALHAKGMEDVYVMWVDIDKLEKIMSNLLSNAMKFTPPNGGQIDVEFDVISADEAEALARAAGCTLPVHQPCIKLTVADTGPGLPEESLGRIFDRYYQLRNQAAGSSSWGTGIGLYYSRTLAQMHHGCLWAENRKEEGKTGSIFTLILPATEEAYTDDERVVAQGNTPIVQPVKGTIKSDTDDSPETETSSPSDEASVGLLIVDDDVEVVTYLRELLSPYYNIWTAFNADEAFTLAHENHPDLIISDVVMPGTDGYDLCRKIKNDLQICHIPVILVTAKATVENQVEGLNTGADAYVTKPFDPQYLLALIKSQLSNRLKARNILNEATETAGIEPDVLSGADKAFMNELYQLMEAELNNSELDITSITDHLHISRTKLFYKIKGLTGSTPAVFFKTYKLNRAAELIAQGEHTMSEIADMTGFSTQAHFSTSFKKHFGVSPSVYQR